MQRHRAWLLASVVLTSGVAGCGSTGTVETHRIPGSETPPPPPEEDADGGEDSGGPCPAGWTCMDISAFGRATDKGGNPVTASCSMGVPMMCDDADPVASCPGLTEPFCATLEALNIVSCAQRCTP